MVAPLMKIQEVALVLDVPLDRGYELAREEFADTTAPEWEIDRYPDWKPEPGKVVIKDRIADAMFQQLLLGQPAARR